MNSYFDEAKAIIRKMPVVFKWLLAGAVCGITWLLILLFADKIIECGAMVAAKERKNVTFDPIVTAQIAAVKKQLMEDFLRFKKDPFFLYDISSAKFRELMPLQNG